MTISPSFQRRSSLLAVSGTLASLLFCPSSQAETAEPIRGRIGLGTWATQAEFKDIKVTKAGHTLFTSNFTKGLAGWKTIRGQWQIADRALRQTSNEQDARALIGDPTWSDYTLTLKARKLSGNEGFLILFAMPDDNAKSWWNLGGWGNTQHAIEAPGVSSPRLPGKIETGRWYDIKIALSGNTIRAYLDNKLIQTATQTPGTHTLVFSTETPGKKLPLRQWGLDTAWANADNMRRGLQYMGKENVDIVRVSFPTNQPLVNGELPPAKDEHFTTRLELAKMAGDKPFTMLPDTEGGVHPWFKNGNEIIPERWVQLMAVSQRRYGKKMMAIEPFNEPDYGWGQGSIQNLSDILAVMQKTPDFAGIQFCGPSTLNDDAAWPWYEPSRSYLQRGTSHALAGNLDNYIRFYSSVVANGQIAENPEVHNVAEVIVGAEYGMKSAIWWGTAELARGEFVKASKGERLAYAEDRARWSAAGVYRTPGGRIQAFVGSSERQGDTTNYRFVSRDRDVFFNGDGPRREFTVPIRRNGEFLVNITWGQDVPPKIDGRYVIVNVHSGKVLGVAGASTENGADIQQMDYTRAANQQWEVAPLVAPEGDQSYFTLRAVHSGKTLDTANWNHDEGGKVQQWGDGSGGAQHWFLEYAGDNKFYIRSRWSTECLGVVDASTGAGASVRQFSRKDDPNLQWRLIPVSALETSPIDFVAPQTPTGLKTVAGPRAVELHWTANRDVDLDSYTIFRAPKPGGPYDTIARGVKGSHFADTGAKGRRKHYYTIKAVDHSLNQSPFSAEASASGSPR